VLSWLKAAASLNTQFVALAENDGAPFWLCARVLSSHQRHSQSVLTRARVPRTGELAAEALGGN
jgi:hypothetical protein